MIVRVDLSGEIERELQDEARSSGKDVEQIVREAVEETLGGQPATNGGQNGQNGGVRLQNWRRWVAARSSQAHSNLDDSRDSIYSGRE